MTASIENIFSLYFSILFDKEVIFQYFFENLYEG